MKDDLHLVAEALPQRVEPEQAVFALIVVEADELSLALAVGGVVAGEEIEAPGGVVIQIQPRRLGVLRMVAVDDKGDALRG